MDPNTGEIKAYEDMTEEDKKRFTLHIPDDMMKRVARMNRKERRKWAAEQRRKEKHGGGL